MPTGPCSSSTPSEVERDLATVTAMVDVRSVHDPALMRYYETEASARARQPRVGRREVLRDAVIAR